jgi:ribonuclease R
MKLSNKQKIIKLLSNPDYAPLKVNEILLRLGMGRDERKQIKNLLKKMTVSKTILKLSSGGYVINNNKKNKKGNTSDNNKDRSWLIGKILKKHNNYLFEPRADNLPTVEVNNTNNLKLKNGSLVLLRINPKSKKTSIEKVLGKSGEINTERKAIIYEHHIPEKFPNKLLSEADLINRNVITKPDGKRLDLRDKLFFTIDNDDARDFDDAVCIEVLKSGFKLYVSIADVSYYVKNQSGLDKEARKRANSVYLPDKVYPMLPEVLSNNLCSLVPNEDRQTKTAEINFSKEGQIKDYKVYNSVINSKARLTYSWVSEMLGKRGPVSKDHKDVINSLRNMKMLYEKLKKIRLENGELEFDFPEPEMIRDSEGNLKNIQKSKRNIANGMIEEFMIAANNVVADYISKSKTGSIYRIHEEPDNASIYELKEALNEIGYKLEFNSKIRPSDIQKVIFKARDQMDQNAVNMLVLRSLKKAEYSTREIGHFGLALDKYTHFTSPIRRYPDLIVHRIIDHLLEGNVNKIELHELNTICEHCSKVERISDRVERESIDLERAYFMTKHVGSEHKGTVISILPFGMFIELDTYFVEGFIPRSDMRMGRKRRWFKIGEKLKVKVTEADVERRRITLGLVS